MMRNPRHLVPLLSSLLLLTLGTAAHSDAAPIDMSDLGALGGSLSNATAMNDNGDVVG
jgi:hypothetical protein